MDLLVKFDQACLSVLVGLRRDDRQNALPEQVLVDPIGTVAHISRQSRGVGGWQVAVIHDVSPFEQVDQGLRLVRLPWREMEVERAAVPVAEEMDLRRESASQAA